MFNFLKLRKSSSGDARRHVPFISIINKHIFTLLLIFIILVSTSPSVNASAFGIGIPIPMFPISGYNPQGIDADFELLNEDQKQIVHEIMGSYVGMFFAGSNIRFLYMLEHPEQARFMLREWGISFLSQFFSTRQNEFYLCDVVGSTIRHASNYSSYEEYEEETSDANNHAYVEVPPNFNQAMKNWVAKNGTINDLMNAISIPWSTSFEWKQYSLSDSYADDYNELIDDIPSLKRVYCNIYDSHGYTSYKNAVAEFNEKYCLFIDTTNNTYYLVNPDGTRPVDHYSRFVYVDSSFNSHLDSVSVNFFEKPLNQLEYYNNGSPWYLVIREIFNLFEGSIYGPCFGHWSDNTVGFKSTKVIDRVFVGADWLSSQEVYNIDDLNVQEDSESTYIDNIPNTSYMDVTAILNALDVEDITDQKVKDIVYPNTHTIDNTGEDTIPVDQTQTVPIDVYVTVPDSGIVVPPNLFAPFFNSGRGFVEYMWYMTKPLVKFSGDLLSAVTFGPDGTFSQTGPGYFILGVVACGLIGGFIAKCLL